MRWLLIILLLMPLIYAAETNPPIVSDVRHDILYNGDVKVSAMITDESGISTAMLKWSYTDELYYDVCRPEPCMIEMFPKSNNIYEATIPLSRTFFTTYYSIFATDNAYQGRRIGNYDPNWTRKFYSFNVNKSCQDTDMDSYGEGKECPDLCVGQGPAGKVQCEYTDENGCCPCTESWTCSVWSECSGRLMTRKCSDQNNCGTIFGKPSESEACFENEANMAKVTDKTVVVPVPSKKLFEEIVISEKGVSGEMLDQEIDRMVENYNKTKNAVEIQHEITYDESTGKTSVTIHIDPKNELKNFTLYESIPKCMALYLAKVKFNDPEAVKVLKDDPLVMWHFDEVKEKVDLRYEVDKTVLEECIKLLQSMGMADDVGKEVKADFIERMVGSKKAANVIKITAGIIVIPLIIYIFLYFGKFRKDEGNI